MRSCQLLVPICIRHDCQYVNPEIFVIIISDLFQVKCKVLQPKIELPLPSVSKLIGPTSRSKLDPIVYNSMDYRDPSTTSSRDFKIYKFSSPRSEPPQFGTGITALDISPSGMLSLDSSVSCITKESFKVVVNSWCDTVKHGAGCTFFEFCQTDSHFQHGSVVTSLEPMYPKDHKITSFPRFTREFTEDVEVVTWFDHIKAHCFKTGFLDIDTCTNSTKWGYFELVYGACRQPQQLYNLGTTWIAYPKSKPGIDSGRINKVKFGLVGAANEAQGTVTMEATFKKKFKKPPQVWLALCGINITLAGDNLRLRTQVVKDSITTIGFNYEVISWGKNVLETVSLYWLAVELD